MQKPNSEDISACLLMSKNTLLAFYFVKISALPCRQHLKGCFLRGGKKSTTAVVPEVEMLKLTSLSLKKNQK
jgi:hypothetical protein